MKTILSFFAAVISFTLSAQIVTIPDAKFKAYLIANSQINTNGDNEIQVSEATNFTGEIDCSGKNISKLTGIESFINIYRLDCSSNSLGFLNVTKNIKLKELYCDVNQLTSLDVSKNVILERLYSGINNFTSIDISKNILLKILHLPFNQIVNIDVSKNIALVDLDLNSNSLENIDISKNTNLYIFACSVNKLTNLNISKNLALDMLICGANKLTSLDISKNLSLTHLDFTNNQITNLDVSKNISLTRLVCMENKLTNLNISKNVNLSYLSCSGNQLIDLDISKNKKISSLFCQNNNLSSLNLKNGFNNLILSPADYSDFFNATGNFNLSCIQVDDTSYSSTNWPYKDSWTSYNTNCSLAVNDVKKSVIQIFPNPVKEKFIISTNDKIENIEIYSQTGQLLRNAKSKEVNISNFPKGNYIVKIKTDKDNFTQKIIKE